jgi:hypothetical protein
MGDFNEILYSFEKEGGRARPNKFLLAFHDALINCGLTDLGYTSDKFTWHRGGIRERLDRAIACDDWRGKFPNAKVENLNYSRSDHRPLLLSFGVAPILDRQGRALLRFEARWLKEKSFRQVVTDAWEASSHQAANGLADRLSVVHDNLHRWDRMILKKPQKKINSIKKEVEDLTRSDLTEENIAREKELVDELEKLLEQEETYWAQRSRVNWLKHGDKNTRSKWEIKVVQ